MIALPDFLPTIKPGLHIVATPIGNLGDITLRGLSVLNQVDQILCEDTRISSKLLHVYGIHGTLSPYHEHNADKVRPKILDRLKQGAKIALISDAGTPLISDPGYKLVRLCYDHQIFVTTIPGPSAVIAALVLSGMPSDRFLFAGFVQSNKFIDYKEVPATLIFYEAPQRLVSTLNQMSQIFAGRQVAVVREMTKVYEEVVRGNFSQVIDAFDGQDRCRGEMVIVLSPPTPEDILEQDIDNLLVKALQDHSMKDAVTIVSGMLKLPRKQVYNHALNLKTKQTNLPS